MMIPDRRLLWVVALCGLPLGLLPAIMPQAAGFALLAGLLLLAVALWDAWRAPARLTGIRLELPPLSRLAKDRPHNWSIRIHNPSARPCCLRLALQLPPALSTAAEETDTRLPAGAEWLNITWPIVPRQRGRFTVNLAAVETRSPLGWWRVRARLPVSAELRVYPNLAIERSRLASLFLNRGAFGIHALRQVGKGREFELLREYLPGDSYEDIHWKATARRARPITKVYQIEKTQEVYVIIDASRLSARPAARLASPSDAEAGSAPADSALERFLTAALVLGLAAERQGDLFGLLTFTDKIERFVRARNGRHHYQTCRDALYTLMAREVTPDFDEVASFIRLRLRRRALLVFLTSLEDPVLAETFLRNIEMLCHQHLMLVNMLQPPLARPIFSPAPLQQVDDLYPQLAGHLQWRRLRELDRAFQRRGVHFRLVENENLSTALVAEYLSVKRRQLL